MINWKALRKKLDKIRGQHIYNDFSALNWYLDIGYSDFLLNENLTLELGLTYDDIDLANYEIEELLEEYLGVTREGTIWRKKDWILKDEYITEVEDTIREELSQFWQGLTKKLA